MAARRQPRVVTWQEASSGAKRPRSRLRRRALIRLRAHPWTLLPRYAHAGCAAHALRLPAVCVREMRWCAGAMRGALTRGVFARALFSAAVSVCAFLFVRSAFPPLSQAKAQVAAATAIVAERKARAAEEQARADAEAAAEQRHTGKECVHTHTRARTRKPYGACGAWHVRLRC